MNPQTEQEFQTALQASDMATPDLKVRLSEVDGQTVIRVVTERAGQPSQVHLQFVVGRRRHAEFGLFGGLALTHQGVALITGWLASMGKQLRPLHLRMLREGADRTAQLRAG